MGFFDSTKKQQYIPQAKLKRKKSPQDNMEDAATVELNNGNQNDDLMALFSLLSIADNQNEHLQDHDLLAGLQCWSNGDRKSAISHFGQSMNKNNPYGALGLAAISEELFFIITQGQPYDIGSNKEIDAVLTGIISSSFFVWGTDQTLAEKTGVSEILARVAKACSSENQFWMMCENFKYQIIQDLDVEDFDF